MKSNHSLRHRCCRLLQIALLLGGWCSTAPTARAIIGYVNVPVTNSFNFLVNPLHAGPSNNIGVVFANATPPLPDGCIVWLWNTTNQAFDPESFYLEGFGWFPELQLPPGRGFVLYSPENFTWTAVGEVLTGSITNLIVGSNRLSLVGSKIPVTGQLAGSPLNFSAGDGDLVSVFPTPSQRYLDGFTYFSGHGWFDPKGLVNSNGPQINLATSFFVRRKGADTNWIQVLNPIVVNQLSTGGGGSGPPPPDIVGLTIQNGQATLRVSATNQPFNVQFSPDRVFWTTIATNQIGGTWTGPCPAAGAGYFQLVSP